MKRPAFQFYPADWRKDMALQSCSVAARGLWMDMMCIAHECEPYGHLTVNGRPMTAAQIGRHTGLTERECVRLISELEDAGVPSRTAEGAIFSRRMVADEDLRNRRAEGGKAGSEHGIKGAEHGKKGGRPPKARGVSEPPFNPPPSSSSSSSEGGVEPDGSTPPAAGSNPGLDGEYEPPPDAALPGLEYARIAGCIRRAGLAALDPGYPSFRALVDAGATAEEFIGFVAEALEKDQPFKWLIGAVAGERKRAAQLAGQLHRGAMPNKQQALEQRNRAVGEAWAAKMLAEGACDATE